MDSDRIINKRVNVNNSNTTAEETESESILPPSLQYAFGFFGNVMAIFFLCRSAGEHKWKPFYRLVCGLAITDFCGIALVYPAIMARYISGFTFEFPKQLCEYCSFWFCFSFMSSALIVSAMSFDRFLAVRFPIWYRNSQETRANTMLLVIWAFTATVSSLNLIGIGSVKNFYPGSWCFIDFANKGLLERVNTYIYSIIGFIILLITVILNVAVAHSVCRKPVSTTVDNKRKRNDIYIIIFLFSVVTLFSICWVPLMVRMLMNASARNPKNGPEELLAVRLTINNSIVDPWIYIILRRENLVKIASLVRRFNSRNHRQTNIFTVESYTGEINSNTIEHSPSLNIATCTTQL
ncbi:prostaglandin E2 receptor EP4 subtype-like [Saccostrea echinata]|uniref:prostaglandin E2 receptor EP4 subtype-like n=1 Tax=Saccostrea echinata TaxID=191078 RepID=UPI002A7FC98E|nr:prostaglandin E2 receptor EP4 subtype-like [Saccostrea echinata]